MGSDSQLPRLEASRKSGRERFVDRKRALGFQLSDFWQWSCSDLVSNATRGVLAEFLVAKALDATDGARGEWDAYDVMTASGIKVEVKSAAYVQSWHQEKPSLISFGIAASRGWDADTGVFEKSPERQADVYVFCLLAHADQASIDPMDVSQWKFYVLPTHILNRALPNGKTLGLRSLLKLTPGEVKYDTLSEAVAKAAKCEAG